MLFHSSLFDEIGILGQSRILLSIVATRRDIGQPAFDPAGAAHRSRGFPDAFPTLSRRFPPSLSSRPPTLADSSVTRVYRVEIKPRGSTVSCTRAPGLSSISRYKRSVLLFLSFHRENATLPRFPRNLRFFLSSIFLEKPESVAEPTRRNETKGEEEAIIEGIIRVDPLTFRDLVNFLHPILSLVPTSTVFLCFFCLIVAGISRSN